jgi:lantibiotic modifying enzyme
VGLAAAAVATGDAGVLEAAVAAIRFERSRFDPQLGAWPDLRPGSSVALNCSWCNGALGIALARQHLLDLVPQHDEAARWRDELRVAAQIACRHPLLPRDHLCCGNLGVAAGLTWLGQRQDEPDWLAAADARTEATIERASRSGGFTINRSRQLGDLSPGLIAGLAGIGMHLLHRHHTDWVPALLR